MLAKQNNIPVLQPDALKNSEIQQTFRELAPDLLIVVAYGMILPEKILNIPKYGCLNVLISLSSKCPALGR